MTQNGLIIFLEKNGFEHVGSTNTREIYSCKGITVKIIKKGNYGVETIINGKSISYPYNRSNFQVNSHIAQLVKQYL